MILAIDTATQYAGLALFSQDGIIAEEYWCAGRRHTVELMPRLVRMLELAKLSPADLTALAVTLGPGSFTGLRIGLAVAKGVALPHKLPMVGVPTLEITAQPFKGRGLPVWAVAQAGRGRIVVACYALRGQQWQPVVNPYRTTVEALAEKINRPALVTGEIGQTAAALLESRSRAQVVSPADRVRRAAYLAQIAAGRLELSEQDDPDSLEPIYLTSP